jgi:hypothetical protein
MTYTPTQRLTRLEISPHKVKSRENIRVGEAQSPSRATPEVSQAKVALLRLKINISCNSPFTLQCKFDFFADDCS